MVEEAMELSDVAIHRDREVDTLSARSAAIDSFQSSSLRLSMDQRFMGSEPSQTGPSCF